MRAASTGASVEDAARAAVQTAVERLWGAGAAPRAAQVSAAAAVLRGRDALVLAPTGYGKSLIYQCLPEAARALRERRHSARGSERTELQIAGAAGGIVVVVTPLLALAADQTRSCEDRGLSVAQWHSAISPDTLEKLARELTEYAEGDDPEDSPVDVLFATPEALARNVALRTALAELAKAGRVLALAVDEAHCVASWGHDFRPCYLVLGALRDGAGGEGACLQTDTPMVALTATATAEVEGQIREALGLRNDCNVERVELNRPNLRYEVLRKEDLRGASSKENTPPGPCSGGGGESKGRDEEVVEDGLEEGQEESDDDDDEKLLSYDGAFAHLAAFICEQQRAGHAGIVFCRRRATVDRLASALVDEGVQAEPFHAGLAGARRSAVLRDFMQGDETCVVATVAFGMGMDRADVRYVCHWNLPGMTAYYQPSGRAGRDGARAICRVYVDEEDTAELCRLERGGGEDGEAQGAVAFVARRAACRRSVLLSHFGRNHSRQCKQGEDEPCDRCRERGSASPVMATAQQLVLPSAIRSVSVREPCQPRTEARRSPVRTLKRPRRAAFVPPRRTAM